MLLAALGTKRQPRDLEPTFLLRNDLIKSLIYNCSQGKYIYTYVLRFIYLSVNYKYTYKVEMYTFRQKPKRKWYFLILKQAKCFHVKSVLMKIVLQRHVKQNTHVFYFISKCCSYSK